MNWSRTKSIFIVAFLILNVFLTWELIETNSANQLHLITEATIQERLDLNNVKIDIELPEEDLPGLHVIGRSTPLNDNVIAPLHNQDAMIIDERTIVSILDEPYDIDPKQFQQDIHSFLSSYIFRGNEYQYGRYDTDARQFLLYQTFEDKTAYTYGDEPLVLQLDDNQRIIGYEQSYYTFEEVEGREREILSSLKAIEILLNEQLIRMNSTVSNVQFGYYSFFSLQHDVQIFAPMWRVVVEGETYLVNAIEGSVQQLT